METLPKNFKIILKPYLQILILFCASSSCWSLDVLSLKKQKGPRYELLANMPAADLAAVNQLSIYRLNHVLLILFRDSNMIARLLKGEPLHTGSNMEGFIELGDGLIRREEVDICWLECR